MVSHIKGKKRIVILVAVESNFEKLFLEVIHTQRFTKYPSVTDYRKTKTGSSSWSFRNTDKGGARASEPGSPTWPETHSTTVCYGNDLTSFFDSVAQAMLGFPFSFLKGRRHKDIGRWQ